MSAAPRAVMAADKSGKISFDGSGVRVATQQERGPSASVIDSS